MFGIFKPTTESSRNPNAKMIDLTIKTLDSQNHKFSVPDTFTVLKLKEFIAPQVNIEVVQQRLIFCGRVLSNETKLADIGIDGKAMHLVQKVPQLSTTTSGSSSSTTTNTTSHSGQDAELGFRGFHAHNPTGYSGIFGITPELLQATGLPRFIRTRNPGTCNKVTLALDMIRRGNEILNRLERPLPNPSQSSASNAEQYPEGSQHADASSILVSPERVEAPESFLLESSASESYYVPQSQIDSETINVFFLDEILPNAIVLTTDGPHHMSMHPGLMRQVDNYMEPNNLFPIYQNATEISAENEFSNVPVGGSTNQSSAEPSSITVPSSASSEHNLRNDQTSENRSTSAVFSRLHLRELIEELNKLNERFRPFYAMYCQSIIDDPRFDTTEGEHGSLRAQSIFDGVSQVMHYISHVYHTISDMRMAFNTAPPRSLQYRPDHEPPSDSTPHIDPFLPCSSHHFERNVRSVVLERSSTQGTDSSTSSATSGNSTAQATGQSSSFTDTSAEQIRGGLERFFGALDGSDLNRVLLGDLNLPIPGTSIPADFVQSTPYLPNRLRTTPIGEIPYFRSLEGQSMLVDFFMIISRDWTLHDMLSVNLMSETSTLRTHPVTAHSKALINFVLNRVMLNRPPSNENIEDAANRIFLEISRYISVIERNVPIRTSINVIASFRRCVFHHLREIIIYCSENRMGAIDNIVHLLTLFAKGFLSLIAYCCNRRSIFRLCVSLVMQHFPLPSNIRPLIMQELTANVDQYWDRIRVFQMTSFFAVNYIIPLVESTQPLVWRTNNSEQSNPSMPSSKNINERSPKVVIGSQDLHHNAPSVLAPATAGPSKPQKRQATQAPHGNAHSSGVPKKCRKIVTSSKPQDFLSQMIAKNLEAAMGAAGVAINKEVVTSVGADTAVQNAYTECIRTSGNVRLDTHPDFCPTRYPNASKFFSVHHHSKYTN